MKKLVITFALIAIRLSATQVSATITSSEGVPFAYGTWQADLVNSTGTAIFLAPGASAYSGLHKFTGVLDSTGSFTATLTDNASIQAGSQWEFTICAASNSAFIKGSSACFSSFQTVSGSTLSLSAAISSSAPSVAVTSPPLLFAADPVLPNQAATKNYVDTHGGGTAVLPTGNTGQILVYPSNGTAVAPHTLAAADVSNALTYTPFGPKVGPTVLATALGWVCDGSADNGANGAALTTNNYLKANDNTLLIFPTDGDCAFTGLAANPLVGPDWLAGVNNVRLKGLRTKMRNLQNDGANTINFEVGGSTFICGSGPITNPTGNYDYSAALINTVAAQSYSVTVQSSGAIVGWLPNDRVFMYGFDQQAGGFPPNYRYFEWHTIQSIVGNQVNFYEPTQFAYNQNWYFSVTANTTAPAIRNISLGTNGPSDSRTCPGGGVIHRAGTIEIDGFDFSHAPAGQIPTAALSGADHIKITNTTFGYVYPSDTGDVTIDDSTAQWVEIDKLNRSFVTHNFVVTGNVQTPADAVETSGSGTLYIEHNHDKFLGGVNETPRDLVSNDSHYFASSTSPYGFFGTVNGWANSSTYNSPYLHSNGVSEAGVYGAAGAYDVTATTVTSSTFTVGSGDVARVIQIVGTGTQIANHSTGAILGIATGDPQIISGVLTVPVSWAAQPAASTVIDVNPNPVYVSIHAPKAVDYLPSTVPPVFQGSLTATIANLSFDYGDVLTVNGLPNCPDAGKGSRAQVRDASLYGTLGGGGGTVTTPVVCIGGGQFSGTWQPLSPALSSLAANALTPASADATVDANGHNYTIKTTAPAAASGNPTYTTPSTSIVGADGQGTTGTTGQNAGSGNGPVISGGKGGSASTGSNNGYGGSPIIHGGAPGTGTGGAGNYGDVLIQDIGNGYTLLNPPGNTGHVGIGVSKGDSCLIFNQLCFGSDTYSYGKIQSAGPMISANRQDATLYSAAGTPLPTCFSGNQATYATVSDAQSYSGNYASGGTIVWPTYCDGGGTWKMIGSSGGGGSMVYPAAGIAQSSGSAWGSALGLVTTVGSPGLDTNIPTEKAIRTALAAVSGSLPAQTGNAGYITTNGTSYGVGDITTGPSGALCAGTGCSGGTPGIVDIVTSVVPRLAAANTFSGVNTFTQVPVLPAGNASATVASGTAALGTSAIASGACASAVTVTATGVLTTDVIAFAPNADITGVTGFAPSTSGGLSITDYPTAGGVNFKVCNWSGSSITPGAVTLNWRVNR